MLGKHTQDSINKIFYSAKHIEASKQARKATENRPSPCCQVAMRPAKDRTEYNASDGSDDDPQNFERLEYSHVREKRL